MIKNNDFSGKLLQWYRLNHRNLPWRNTENPYHIWLSEIILQQTRVSQGLAYYVKFVENFPTVKKLAEASEEKVLRLWQGLGYYSRARNLHSAAQTVVNDYGAEFPKTYKELLKLKGVGEYTAAAVASFAYKEIIPVVDGNVFRVLSRIFGLKDDISMLKSKKVFQDLASLLIPNDKPDLFNQAIMEFGALQCKPKSPDCTVCVFNDVCFANQNGLVTAFPVKTKKVKVKTRYFHYYLIRYREKIIFKIRPEGDIWQHLFEPYLIEVKNEFQNPRELLLAKLKFTNITRSLKPVKHVLTHRIIYAYFHHVELSKDEYDLVKDDFSFSSDEEIESLPKPILIANYLSS